jgi:hypothetical protein
MDSSTHLINTMYCNRHNPKVKNGLSHNRSCFRFRLRAFFRSHFWIHARVIVVRFDAKYGGHRHGETENGGGKAFWEVDSTPWQTLERLEKMKGWYPFKWIEKRAHSPLNSTIINIIMHYHWPLHYLITYSSFLVPSDSTNVAVRTLHLSCLSSSLRVTSN